MKAHRNLISTFLVLSFSFSIVFANEPDTILSLKRIIQEVESDSARAGRTLILADRYQDFGSLDSSLKYLDKVDGLNIMLEDDHLQARSIIVRASAFLDMGLADTAETLLLSALELSERGQYEMITGQAHNGLARVYDFRGDLMLAKEHFEIAREIFIDLKDTLYVAGMNQNIAVIYTSLGLIDEALSSYLASLDIYEKKGSQSNIAIILNNISRLYSELGEAETAYEYLQRAISISKEIGDRSVLSMSYINLSTHYSKMEEHLKALKALDDAEANFPSTPPVGRLARVYYNRGLTHLELKDMSAAENNFKSCLDVSSEFSYTIGIIYGSLGLGMVNERIGYYSKAKAFLTRALELSNRMGDIESTIAVLAELMEVEKSREDYKASLEYAERYYMLKDSLLNETRTTEIARLKTVYDTEKKEKENLLLKQEQEYQQLLVQSQSDTIHKQNTAVIIISLVSILLLIALILFFRERVALKNVVRKLGHQNQEIIKQQEKLHELIATRDRFFSIIAHDLKSPFNSLIGYTAMLEDADLDLDMEQRKELISQLRQSSLNTYELLENLLGWAMSQRGNMKVHAEVLVLKDIVDSGMKYLKSKADEKSVVVNNELDPGTRAFADPKMTESVIRNLLSNAIKFSNKGGIITVDARQVDFKTMQLTVSDEGIGISSKDLEDLFKIDKKVSRRGTGDESGTGLGLILCREFVLLQQGEISIESTLGEGTQVSFTLPSE